MSVLPGVRSGPVRRIGVALGLAWRYLKAVLGEDRYDGYLAWHRQHGTGEPMTAAEYWRSRTDHQEAHPEGRCC